MVIGIMIFLTFVTIANITIFKFFFGWWQSILFGYVATIFEFAIFTIISIIKEKDDEV